MFRRVSAGAVVLFCFLYSSLEGVGSTCVATLPQSEQELRELVEGPSTALSLQHGDEARLFPNITFNCTGSVVGWSLIAPLHDSPPGRRPIMNVWSPSAASPGEYRQLRQNSTVLVPCLKTVISEERGLYLYENTTMEPLEFQPEDILGLVLRDPEKKNSIFTPYMMSQISFVAYYRNGNNARPTQTIHGLKTDNLMPLLFLHICSMDDVDYEKCLKEYERPHITCTEITPEPRGREEEEEEENGKENKENGVSQMVLAVSLGVSLTLALLVVTTLLVLTLGYVTVTKRRGRRKAKGPVADTTDNTSEAQPYAEPFPSRMHTPLPPPPTHPPPPPNGLSVQQPTYATLDGPSPSPPPPYSLDLSNSRAPPLGDLPSPQYESIDGHERKAALLRQNATESNLDSADYSQTNAVNAVRDSDGNQ